MPQRGTVAFVHRDGNQVRREMNTLSKLVALTSLTSPLALAAAANFDGNVPSEPPPEWTVTKTGSGEPRWTIEKDDSAPSRPNVLKQSGNATYPLIIKDNTNLENGFVEVKFKAVGGKGGPGRGCHLAGQGRG